MDIVWQKIEERFSLIKTAFRYFDKDNSGSISYNEFVYGVENLGIKLSNEQLRRVFQYIDQDSNGSINFNEFR